MLKTLISLIILITFGCSHQSYSPTKTTNRPSGEISYGAELNTYRAEYKGKESLKIGDKVRIMQYEFAEGLKQKQSRAFPLTSTKKQIGEATVSGILGDQYYELKTTSPHPLPGNAFIEKL